MRKIQYGKQNVSQEDIDSVIEVLQSDFLTQGPKVELFEKALAEKTSCHYAVAVNSATSALHIACLALELKKGDIVWTSPITFVASSNSVLYCGAQVDFVDINLATYNMCPIKLEEKLINAKKNNRLPKIVMPVHMAGQSCDMEKIYKLSQEYGFKIIEDASHAIGGSYKGYKVGSCKYSDITVFSFHPVKIITTGEGGCALTNNQALAEKMALLRSHGVTRNKNLMINDQKFPWFYQQIELGYNYRMTDIQAALGLSQLRRLDMFVEKRNELAQFYQQLLSDLPFTLPQIKEGIISSFHLYIVLYNCNKTTITNKSIFEKMNQKGVGVSFHYPPVHTQPFYQKLGFKMGNFPNAEEYAQRAISLPLHPILKYKDLEFIKGNLKSVSEFV